MPDRVSIQIEKTRINEGSHLFVNATVLSGDQPVVPTTLEWRLYNKTRGLLLVDWKSIDAAASSTILIDAKYSLCSATNETERVAFMVAADRGLPTAVIGVARYLLVNNASYGKADQDAIIYLMDEAMLYITDQRGERIKVH